MSEQFTININHAFDGFLYAPLFLAEELGFFPKCAKLVYRNGDSKCLDVLCKHTHNGEKNWFAICDPFSVPDFSTKLPEQTEDDICVVGSLINKLPVWLYNPDPLISPVRKEEELINYKNKIKTLICYKEGTTGHLIGRRLHRLSFSDSNLEQREFGQEFTTAIGNDVAVVSSDVLRLVHRGINDGQIIFNYPARSPDELRPFLFTGILTLRNEVLNENLWAALTILAGIKHAVDLLRSKVVPADCINALVRRFRIQMLEMGVTDHGKQEELIKESIHYAFHVWELYSENLKPEKEAWDNAKNEWEKTKTQKFADAEERNDPIPSLLIKRDWRRNAELRSHINKGFTDPSTVLTSGLLKWYHKLSLPGVLLYGLVCLLALLNAANKAQLSFRDNAPFLLIATLAFFLQVAFTIKFCKKLLKLELTGYDLDILTIFMTGGGTIATAVEGIK